MIAKVNTAVIAATCSIDIFAMIVPIIIIITTISVRLVILLPIPSGINDIVGHMCNDDTIDDSVGAFDVIANLSNNRSLFDDGTFHKSPVAIYSTTTNVLIEAIGWGTGCNKLSQPRSCS
jgi:hypothetical protein